MEHDNSDVRAILSRLGYGPRVSDSQLPVESPKKYGSYEEVNDADTNDMADALDPDAGGRADHGSHPARAAERPRAQAVDADDFRAAWADAAKYGR